MMKRTNFVLSSFCILCLSFAMTACGNLAFTSTGNGGTTPSNPGGDTTSNPSVTTTSIPVGTVGSAYSVTLRAKGGTAPYKWSLKSGSLPAGVSLSAAGGITGTPAEAGTAGSLIFEVMDAHKKTANSRDLSLTIHPEAAPVVQTSSLQNGNVGVTYAATLTATGGTKPYTWSVKSGTLPAGLSLDSETGIISGTPAQPGSFNSLVFDVTDFYNSVGASRSLSVKIDPVIEVLTTSLPNGQQGTTYSASLAATGGSGVYTWSLKSGNLPPGLSLNPSTGAITGTPTTPNIFNGLVFEATDADTAAGSSGALSVQIYNTANCSAGTESSLGTQPFAFLIKGFEPSSGNLAPISIVGSFTPDGRGGISDGEEDINSANGAQSDLAIIAANSSYSLGPDNNGCLVLATSAGTTSFHFSVGTVNGSGTSRQGHIMLDDSNGTGARGTGVLRLQDPSAFAAGLTGTYAFLFAGTDTNSGNFGVVGSFRAAGGKVENLTLDGDDAGTLVLSFGNGKGLYSPTDTNGRGTALFAATSFGRHYSMGSVFYVVSSTEVLFASNDPLATNPICGGRALATDSSLFSAAYLNSNYVAHGMGLDANDIPAATIATVTFDGISRGSGSLIQDQGGSVSSGHMGVHYFVDTTTGRVIFAGNFITPVGYLVTGFDGVSALLVGNDVAATSGTLEPQQEDPQPESGIYSIGTEQDADYLTPNQVGTFNLISPDFSGTEDLSNAATPFLEENQSVSNSFALAGDGTGSFGGNDAVSTGSTIYFIDEGAGVNTHPAIISVTK